MTDLAVPEAVVIGVGNPLMGDDGIGIAALERLSHGYTIRPHLELLDGGTWGLNLLPHVERSSHVLFIDAIDIGGEPGTVVELRGSDLPRFLAQKLSPHQIDVKEVLALAELRGTLPPELVAVGLQPESVEMRIGLSPRVTGAMGTLIGRVIECLGEWGFEVAPTGTVRNA